MNCPYCNTEMQIGDIINCKEPIIWSPKGLKVGHIQQVVGYCNYKKGQMHLGKRGDTIFGVYATMEAHYCPHCKIVLIPNVE